MYSPEELIGQTHLFSNAEMNKMIYQQARDLVDAGVIKDWPENLARIQFHHEKERIPLERDMAGRIFIWHKQSYPEMTNPELCKKDQRYPVLQKAEDMILHTCRQHGVKEEFPTPGRN